MVSSHSPLTHSWRVRLSESQCWNRLETTDYDLLHLQKRTQETNVYSHQQHNIQISEHKMDSKTSKVSLSRLSDAVFQKLQQSSDIGVRMVSHGDQEITSPKVLIISLCPYRTFKQLLDLVTFGGTCGMMKVGI